MKNNNSKELSNFDLKKQGFFEDLKRIRQEIETDVRQQQNKASGGRSTLNANIANWQLLKFPYGSFKARDTAHKNHRRARDAKEQKIRDDIARQFREKRKQLELNIFGQRLAEARVKEKAAADREAKIQAFKERTRQRLEAEQTLKARSIEQSKVQAGKVSKSQKEKLTPEQDNRKALTVGKDFNTQNETQRTKNETDEKIKKFRERSTIKRDSDYTSAEKSELVSGSGDTQDRAAQIEAFKSDFMAEFEKSGTERGDMER